MFAFCLKVEWIADEPSSSKYAKPYSAFIKEGQCAQWLMFKNISKSASWVASPLLDVFSWWPVPFSDFESYSPTMAS
jgi:hypothetical protein